MTDKLYCPRCSKQFSSGTKFCRTCGLSLDGVSEIVSGESASAPTMSSRPNFKVMRLGFGIFILGMVIGLVNGAIKDFGLFPEAYGKAIFLAFIAAGFLAMGCGLVFPTKKYVKRKSSANRSDPSKPLDTAPLLGQLNEARADAIDIEFPKKRSDFEEVAAGSVTEHTTRSLNREHD